MNSIAMYTIVHVAERYTAESLQIHLGRAPFEVFGEAYAPVLLGGATLAIFWGIMFWMYHRKIFIRI
jgi:heparan-alpha-glucosaminide N-acetyltransferase